MSSEQILMEKETLGPAEMDGSLRMDSCENLSFYLLVCSPSFVVNAAFGSKII